MVTDEFSKFADILSAALSQHVYIYLCKNIYFEILAHMIIEAERISDFLHATGGPGKPEMCSEGLRVTKLDA